MGKELELTSSSYALKVNAKEATELHYGCPVEGRWNICLCDVNWLRDFYQFSGVSIFKGNSEDSFYYEVGY